MDISRVQTALRGIAVTTVTPFTSDLQRVDVDGIAANLEFLVRAGVKLVIPCGNTGEFYSLSEHEWTEVVGAVMGAAQDRLVVMPGVGHSIKTAIAQVEEAQKLGAQCVMVMYPQHVFQSEEGLFDYYSEILAAAKDIGVALYKKGPLLTDGMLSKLVKYRNLIAVKYAFGRVVDFTKSVQTLGKPFIWSCGTAERFAPFFWLAGAEGLTTGLGNFAPRISQRMYDSLKSGDMTEAMRIHEMITPFEDLREGRGAANNVPVVKAVMDKMGLAGGDCRPPIHKLTQSEREAALASVKLWGLW